MNANSGYVGWSQSVRAFEAKRVGKLPMTHAIKAVREAVGCTAKVARAALLEVGPCEWHHTSKHFNRTDFYNVRAACLCALAQPELAKLPADWKDCVRLAPRVNHRLDFSIFGIEPLIVEEHYYGTWNDTVAEMDEAGDYEATPAGLVAYFAEVNG